MVSFHGDDGLRKRRFWTTSHALEFICHRLRQEPNAHGALCFRVSDALLTSLRAMSGTTLGRTSVMTAASVLEAGDSWRLLHRVR